MFLYCVCNQDKNFDLMKSFWRHVTRNWKEFGSGICLGFLVNLFYRSCAASGLPLPVGILATGNCDEC